ncbi:hypothetical protein WJX81_007230 [Elliptochloris bilobata]|uniref:UspA domain-containing protein n=1 Tax=Elliptochloris bilobata TaxID=381761 RepID=A0AAW1SBG2_9CHLO
MEHFPGYRRFHSVHVQPHTVPVTRASFTAHVETKPEHTAYDGQGRNLAAQPYDTGTKLDKEQTATTEHFHNQVFVPKMSSNGAKVHATLLHTGGDSSRSVGDALCTFAAKTKPVALVLMKENKSAFEEFFLGSVSRHRAMHCSVPVLVVPA